MRIAVWTLGLGVGLGAASGAMGLGPRAAEAACSPLSSAKGAVSMPIATSTAASYRVWVRVLAPTTTAKSFYVQIADGNLCQATMGGVALPANTWTWVDYQGGSVDNKVNVTLSVASHAVVLAGLDDGLQVDKVLLLSDATCVPAGDGTNCMQMTSSTPVSGGSVGGTPSPGSDVKNHQTRWVGWPIIVALSAAGVAGVAGGLWYLNRRLGWPSRLWQAAEPVERDDSGRGDV